MGGLAFLYKKGVLTQLLSYPRFGIFDHEAVSAESGRLRFNPHTSGSSPGLVEAGFLGKCGAADPPLPIVPSRIMWLFTRTTRRILNSII